MEENDENQLQQISRYRWTDNKTHKLIEAILEIVKENPEAFERPTARKFYEKLAIGKLCDIKWTIMRERMRYLEKCYVAAVSWKTEADQLRSNEKECVLEICPHYLILDQIFNGRVAANADANIEEKSSIDIHEYLEVCDSNDVETMIDSAIDNFDCYSNSETSDSSCDEELLTTENRFKQKRKRMKLQSSSFLTYLSAMQENKLQFEAKKLQMTMEMDEKRLCLETKKLRNDFEIKKLEIKSSERLELNKIKLEIKKQQRIKTFELNLIQRRKEVSELQSAKTQSGIFYINNKN